MASTLNNQPVKVLKLDVYPGHLVCQVQFASTVERRTTPKLIKRVLKCFPNLPNHACVNERANTFGSVINETPLPHLLEHIIVDIQVQMQTEMPKPHGFNAHEISPAFSNGTIVGTSEWLNEKSGIARIDVSFVDDLTALAALKAAVDFLNITLTTSSF